jgi:hypothetical protein
MATNPTTIAVVEPDQDRTERTGMTNGTGATPKKRSSGSYPNEIQQEQVGRDEVSKVKYKLIAGDCLSLHQDSAKQGKPAMMQAHTLFGHKTVYFSCT